MSEVNTPHTTHPAVPISSFHLVLNQTLQCASRNPYKGTVFFSVPRLKHFVRNFNFTLYVHRIYTSHSAAYCTYPHLRIHPSFPWSASANPLFAHYIYVFKFILLKIRKGCRRGIKESCKRRAGAMAAGNKLHDADSIHVGSEGEEAGRACQVDAVCPYATNSRSFVFLF